MGTECATANPAGIACNRKHEGTFQMQYLIVGKAATGLSAFVAPSSRVSTMRTQPATQGWRGRTAHELAGNAPTTGGTDALGHQELQRTFTRWERPPERRLTPSLQT